MGTSENVAQGWSGPGSAQKNGLMSRGQARMTSVSRTTWGAPVSGAVRLDPWAPASPENWWALVLEQMWDGLL